MRFAAILLLVVSIPLAAEKLDASGNSHSKDWAPLPSAEAGKKVAQENVGRFGKARITISPNESVSFGIEMSVELNCGKKSFRAVEPTLRACEFVRTQFDAKTNRLILHFKSTKTVAGREECLETESFDFSLDQHCRK